MRRHIDFDKIGITDDVMFCTVLKAIPRIAESFYRESLGLRLRKLSSWEQVSMKSNFSREGCPS